MDVGSRLGQVKRRAPRRMGQWAAAILFVAMVVIALVALFRSQSDRVEVLMVTDSVPAGQVIERGDLRAAEVAGVSSAIRAADIEEVVGKRAAGRLVEGQVLTGQAISAALVPGEGRRLVALNLPTGRVPGELSGGDTIVALSVPVEGADGTREQLEAPQVLAESATVQDVGKTPEGTVVVTVLVPEEVSDSLAAYSSAGQVTIIQAPAAGPGE